MNTFSTLELQRYNIHIVQGCQHCVSKQSGNSAKCLLPQVIGLPRHRRSQLGALFPFLSKITKLFCKIELKFLSSRAIAGGFAMGCAKKVLVLSI